MPVQRAWLVALVAVAIAAVAVMAEAYGSMEASEERQFAPIKDGVLVYLASNHPDAVPFLQGLDLIYQGRGVYSGSGWYIEIEGRPSNWTIYADFSSALTQNASGIPHRIIWEGTLLNGTIVETGYTHAV